MTLSRILMGLSILACLLASLGVGQKWEVALFPLGVAFLGAALFPGGKA